MERESESPSGGKKAPNDNRAFQNEEPSLEHGFGLNPSLCWCGAAETEPRILDMATTFAPKPLMSALQFCGRVIPDTLKKEKSTNILLCWKERFLALGHLAPAKKLHWIFLCHFTGTLGGIWSLAWCEKIKRRQTLLDPASGDGGLLNAKWHKGSLPCL